MPAEKSTIKSETRRGSKPLVEKKRRARINQSLAELQTLVLTNINKEGYNKQSRVEKADILEMTVRYLQKLQNQQKDEAPSLQGKFQAGYLECVSQVSRYLTSVEKVDPHVNERLRRHLLVNLQRAHPNPEQVQAANSDVHSTSVLDIKHGTEVDSCSSSPKVSTTTPTPSSSPTPFASTSLSSHVTDSANANSLGLPVACTETLTGVPVIPSRLPTGQLAFVVPTKEYLHCINIYSPSLPVMQNPRVLPGGNSPSLMNNSSCSSHQMSTSDIACCGVVNVPSNENNILGLMPFHMGNVWRPW